MIEKWQRLTARERLIENLKAKATRNRAKIEKLETETVELEELVSTLETGLNAKSQEIMQKVSKNGRRNM